MLKFPLMITNLHHSSTIGEASILKNEHQDVATHTKEAKETVNASQTFRKRSNEFSNKFTKT